MIPFANGGEQYHRDSSGDWQAVLRTNESFPGSDIDLVNEATGEVLAIALKATASPAWIEIALVRYPDIYLLTTDEVAAHFAGDPRVTGGAGISNTELTEVTEENSAQSLDTATPPDPGEVAAGVAAAALATLWPFTLAYLRGRISDEQLVAAFTRVLGDSCVTLAAR